MINRTISIKLTKDCFGAEEYDIRVLLYSGRRHFPPSKYRQKETWLSTVLFRDLDENEYVSNILEEGDEFYVSIYQKNDIKDSRPENIYFKTYRQVERSDIDEISFTRWWNYSTYVVRYPSKDFNAIYKIESETDIVTEEDEIILEIFDIRYITGHKTDLFDNGLLVCDITKGDMV